MVTRVKKARQTVLLDEGRNEAQRMLRTWVFIERELGDRVRIEGVKGVVGGEYRDDVINCSLKSPPWLPCDEEPREQV